MPSPDTATPSNYYILACCQQPSSKWGQSKLKTQHLRFHIMNGLRHHLWFNVMNGLRHHLWFHIMNGLRHHLWFNIMNGLRHHFWFNVINGLRHDLWFNIMNGLRQSSYRHPSFSIWNIPHPLPLQPRSLTLCNVPCTQKYSSPKPVSHLRFWEFCCCFTTVSYTHLTLPTTAEV